MGKSLTIDKSGNVNLVGNLTVGGGTINGNATSATKATNDKNGKDITTTYPTIDEVIHIGTSAPSSTKVKLWLDSNNGNVLKVRNGNSWIVVNGAWGE